MIQVSLTILPIRDADGDVVGASKISTDITQLRETARLQLLLDENNRLLKELNHRVGNNLAIILGLLRKEMRTAPPENRPGFEAAIERVYELATEREERSSRMPTLDPSTGAKTESG